MQSAKIAIICTLLIFGSSGLISSVFGDVAKSYISANLYEEESYRVSWVDVLIGSPVQRQSVSFDTGSFVLGVACPPCITNCGNDKNKVNALFNSDISSSLTFVDCNSADCCANGEKASGKCGKYCGTMSTWRSRTTNPNHKAEAGQPKRADTVELIVPLPNGEIFHKLISNLIPRSYDDIISSPTPSNSGDAASLHGSICGASIEYGEGDGIWGPLFKDKVAFGDLVDKNLAIDYAGVMCFMARDGNFGRSNLSGIVGASYSHGFPARTMMDVAYTDPYVTKQFFGTCASEKGGVLTIGGYDSSLLNGNTFMYTPMVDYSIFYTMDVKSFSFGSTNINASAGSPFKFIVDTGTTYLNLQAIFITSVNNSLLNICSQHSNGENGITCVITGGARAWVATDSADFSVFPEMQFGVVKTDQSPGAVTITYQNYLRNIGLQNGQTVFIEAYSYGGIVNIFGSLAQRNMYIAFDTDGKRIGFASAKCPITDPALRDNLTMPPQEKISNSGSSTIIVLVIAMLLCLVIVGAGGFYGYIYYRKRKSLFPSSSIATSDNGGTEFVRLNRLTRLEHGNNPSLLAQQVS